MWTHALKSNSKFDTFSGMCPMANFLKSPTRKTETLEKLFFSTKAEQNSLFLTLSRLNLMELWFMAMARFSQCLAELKSFENKLSSFFCFKMFLCRIFQKKNRPWLKLKPSSCFFQTVVGICDTEESWYRFSSRSRSRSRSRTSDATEVDG